MHKLMTPLFLAGFLIAAPPAAASGETVVCPPGGTVCYVVVDTPGTTRTQPVSGQSTNAPTCHVLGSTEAVPCSDATFGWWSNVDGCYYLRLNPAPPTTDPSWAGHFPDGAIYQSTCPGRGGTRGGWVWRSTSPPGYGGGAGTTATLAAEAIARLALSGPDIGFAPAPGNVGLVGLPVWMWTRVRAGTWGPVSATASLPGTAVTAKAKAEKIVWDMGDGQTVTCSGPGTPYSRSSSSTTSPTCGYSYEASSAAEPGHAYTVRATTTWAISWRGGASSGQTTQTRSSSVQVQIGELQVLVS